MAIPSTSPKSPLTGSRLGFHYFADTLHYRDADLQTWLPVLQEMGAAWLVLRSDLGRAIPEAFLAGLKQAGIQPVIQFPLSLERLPDLKELNTLVEVYARWGVRYLSFFDRPNHRSAWPSSAWVQQDLVERFLDRWLPAAGLAVQAGLSPVFPALQPGGSYWDTAFLRSALQAIQRRKRESILHKLVLSAYGWSWGRSLNWGAGGPECWSSARPYQDDPAVQDQRGFRIFDWYLAVSRSVLGQDCPLMLFQAGLPGSSAASGDEEPQLAERCASDCQNIARLLAGETVSDPCTAGSPLAPIAESVIAVNFKMAGQAAGEPFDRLSWFDDQAQPKKAGGAVRLWLRQREMQALLEDVEAVLPGHPIRHYLLLPGAEWGISDWYLEVIRPFVKKHRPTVGFAVEEAEKAGRVTIVGNASSYPEDLLNRLREAGCVIEQIGGDGTNIATLLAER
jgi:hypothetical protein